MTEPTAVQRATPSSAILQELLSLRQREGMTLRKIRDTCPHLQWLAVTSHELERRGLDASDRHVAAFEVVCCAVQHLIYRTDFAHVLGGTLAVPLSNGLQRQNRRSPLDLTGRRREIQAELLLSDKVLRRTEEEAYIELAGRLVAAEVSPCDGWSAAGKQARADAPIAISLHLSGDTERLLQALSFMTVERRPAQLEDIARAIFEELPRALDHISGGSVEPGYAREYLKLFLEAVLRNVWPPSNLQRGHVLSAESLDYFLLSAAEPLVKPEEVLAREWPAYSEQHPEIYRKRFGYRLLLQLKHTTLIEFAAYLLGIELEDRWAEVIEGYRDGAGLVRV